MTARRVPLPLPAAAAEAQGRPRRAGRGRGEGTRRGARCPGSAGATRARVGGGRAGGAAPPPAARASGGRRRAVLTLAGRRAGPRSGAGAEPGRPRHGSQAAHPHGQREAQQEHHAARERRQDLEDGSGGEGVGWALAAGALHLRGLRVSHLPDHPEHPDGHVRRRPRRHGLSGPPGPGRAAPRGPARVIPSSLARAAVP